MFGHTPRSHVHSPRRISFRCAHTLWCDRNPPRRFHMRRHQSELNTRRSFFFFFFPLVLSLELHVCNVWQDAGKALDQPRGGFLPREKLGTHLITGPHQMLELFSHQAWNFVCGEMIYNFTLTAGGKHGDRDTENGGKYLSSWVLFFLFSLSASKFLNGFQTLIIFHSVTAITW